MEKVIEFFKKNKATIVSILSAVLTLMIALSKIDMGTKVGVVVSILLVVIPFLIALISGKDMETTITLIVNAIVLIQQIVKEGKKVQEEDIIVSASEYPQEDKELTEEEIRELIIKGL